MTDFERYWVAMGDLHGDFSRIRDIPELPGAQGAILTGDLTTRGDRALAARIIEAVAGVNPVVHAQIGNMDPRVVEAYLDELGVNIHGQGLELAPGLAMAAVGWSTPTPFGTPSELPEARLAELLEQALARTGPFDHLLLVCHEPPKGTRADQVAPGRHVGSPAVRAFIERVRPEVCLTGHIHEARSVDHIGPTTIINPGPLFAGGYAVVGLSGGRLIGELRIL